MQSITFRPVEQTEQAQTLALWEAVFTETPGFFERYFRPEFGYQEGDTLGAWSGDHLVSAVHLCRRPIIWDGTTLLCGGIANVATLSEFRRQGLSRRLLEMTIAKMEHEGFHFSLLGTGVPSHYAALDWELTHPRSVVLDLKADAADTDAVWQPLETTDTLCPLYATSPRPLQFDRSPAYFEDWVGWNLRRISPYLCELPGRGYLVLVVPEDEDQLIFATEWRAVDAITEQELLRVASAEVIRHGRRQLGLEALPQYLSPADLEALGESMFQTNAGSMVRNISLSEDQYRQLVQSYRSSEAVWWSADGF